MSSDTILDSSQVVSLEQYNKLRHQYGVLVALLMGEWVHCQDVQEALKITFEQGLDMFEFGRMASWNPYPQNGQKIITKFRISEKTLRKPMYSFEDNFNINRYCVVPEINSEEQHSDAILKQHLEAILKSTGGNP